MHSIAQILVIISYCATLAVNIYRDGEPHEGEYSATAALLKIALSAGVLWIGGFWY